MLTLPVDITGIGLVTPLGHSVQQTWDALLAGRFVADHARVDGFDGPDRIFELARTAAHEAIQSAGWQGDRLSDEGTGLFVGTSKGWIDGWIGGEISIGKRGARHRAEEMLEPSIDHSGTSNRKFLDYIHHTEDIGLSAIAADLAQHLGLRSGPRMTHSAACASGLHALIRAAMAIAGGEVRRAIVVAAEASVHPMFIASFQRLGVLAPPGEGCKPFDRHRAGFVMTEAAAAVCLERAEDMKRSADPDRSIVRINRFALGGDGMHITAGDATGTNLRRLLKIVLGDEPADLIHAHGTGTVLNDRVEIAAIESRVGAGGEKNVVTPVGDSFVHEPGRPRPGPSMEAAALPRNPVTEIASHRPFIYSHKGSLGHSLGASGLISIVLNCRAHQTSQLPGNVRTTEPLPMDRMQIHREPVAAPIRRSLAIATGFGGPAAVVGLESTQASIRASKHCSGL